ncbi:MAG: zinc ABC transporter substrate-binding protein [Phycisphaerae bacterium]|nr:zinc ABC transporter substrate-binding protein [Phycisphaerae bacterium]
MNRRSAIRTLVFLHLSCAVVMAFGCERSATPAGTLPPNPLAHVAASNSYLEAALIDLVGEGSQPLRLAEPGMCPGHFDIRPSQVSALRACRVLVRFDFQQSLDDKLRPLSRDGLQIASIRPAGGLCEPSSYLATCRQVAEPLVDAGILSAEAVQRRIAEIESRMGEHEQWCRRQMRQAALEGKNAVCSPRQEAFCRWLGLNVVATFAGADSASIGDIETAIREGEHAKVGIVVANLPEGRRLADALGQRLGAKVVVFGNFPDGAGGKASFDALMTANVTSLVKAATP